MMLETVGQCRTVQDSTGQCWTMQNRAYQQHIQPDVLRDIHRPAEAFPDRCDISKDAVLTDPDGTPCMKGERTIDRLFYSNFIFVGQCTVLYSLCTVEAVPLFLCLEKYLLPVRLELTAFRL
jgi:hypothetical protein